MAPVIRRNVLQLTKAEVSQLVEVFYLLKKNKQYDEFVVDHVKAMAPVPGTNLGQAHRSPLFLPWHRAFLYKFEQYARNALGKPDWALPYWDWTSSRAAYDNDKSTPEIFRTDMFGGDGSPVMTGPFRQGLWTTLNPTTGAVGDLERNFGNVGFLLPSWDSAEAAISGFPTYDAAPWGQGAVSFRNALEGWLDFSGYKAPVLHNLVHVWVGGHMEWVPIAPNDPIFFLHHANVDRLWALWQTQYPEEVYQPQGGQVSGINGNDKMPTFNMTPNDVWNMANLNYTYDTLWPFALHLMNGVDIAMHGSGSLTSPYLKMQYQAGVEWRLIPGDTSPWFKIQHVKSQLVVDIYGGDHKPGASVINYTNLDNHDNQCWRFVPTPAEGYYWIESKMKSDDGKPLVLSASPVDGSLIQTAIKDPSSLYQQAWQASAFSSSIKYRLRAASPVLSTVTSGADE